MAEIISVDSATSLSKTFKQQNKTCVLVGGCFDILHPGHVIFLEKAKKAGDILMVLLESDQKVKELKGINRPMHTQQDRAKVLSALKSVDHVVLLPYLDEDQDYERLINQIRPDIIAATKGDSNNYHKERIAKLTGSKLVMITKMIGNHSTSRILRDRH